MTPFFSGIALDVTPQIDRRGGVTLHIHPSVSEVEDQTKTFTIDDRVQTLPTAQSTIRESDSIVYAYSGQIVVIGGLMQQITGEELAATPVLGDVPFFGTAFRQTKQVSSKTELVILLKPLVVEGPGGWSDPIAQSTRQVAARPTTPRPLRQLKREQSRQSQTASMQRTAPHRLQWWMQRRVSKH